MITMQSSCLMSLLSVHALLASCDGLSQATDLHLLAMLQGWSEQVQLPAGKSAGP
jgi:hypothetical protein